MLGANEDILNMKLTIHQLTISVFISHRDAKSGLLRQKKKKKSWRSLRWQNWHDMYLERKQAKAGFELEFGFKQ